MADIISLFERVKTLGKKQEGVSSCKKCRKQPAPYTDSDGNSFCNAGCALVYHSIQSTENQGHEYGEPEEA